MLLMNMGVQISIQVSAFVYVPGGGIIGSNGNSLFNFLTNFVLNLVKSLWSFSIMSHSFHMCELGVTSVAAIVF